ncbi:MAG: hypothetical protein AAFY15_14535, partial [Cyanobacteria bacterium J06648_11]
MDWDMALAIADDVFYQAHDRHFTSVEVAILQGAWERQTYEAIADAARYSPTYLKQDVGPKLWKALGIALGEKVSKPTFRSALERKQPALVADPTLMSAPAMESEAIAASVPTVPPSGACLDWGEAPDVSLFYGRAEELDTLTHWISTERNRLVALLGMGGIG